MGAPIPQQPNSGNRLSLAPDTRTGEGSGQTVQQVNTMKKRYFTVQVVRQNAVDVMSIVCEDVLMLTDSGTLFFNQHEDGRVKEIVLYISNANPHMVRERKEGEL